MNKQIIIPFIELIKRSWSNVLLNNGYIVKTAFIPAVILSIIAILGSNVFVTLIFSGLLASFVSVYWCRKIILNEDISKDNLHVREVWNYICKYLLFILIFLTPVIFTVTILAMLNYTAIKTSENATGVYALAFLVSIITSFFCVRLRMALAATAVGDEELGFKLAFAISKENTTRLFFALIAVIIPVSIASQIWASLYGFFESNFVLIAIWNMVFYGLNMLTAAFYASYDAHVYQYFTYFYRKAIEDGEAQEAGELIEDEIKARRE